MPKYFSTVISSLSGVLATMAALEADTMAMRLVRGICIVSASFVYASSSMFFCTISVCKITKIILIGKTCLTSAWIRLRNAALVCKSAKDDCKCWCSFSFAS